MIEVSFENPVVTFNQALHEILSEYFDGAIHRISDYDLQFPQAEIRIDARPISDGISTSIISITGVGSFDFRKHKCHNPNDASMHGYELWATVLRNVSVAVPIHGGLEEKNNKQVHLIWGLLHCIFASKVADFSDRKIYKCAFPPLPEDVVEEPSIAHAAGLLTCEVHLPFACYNLSEIL